MPVRPLRVLIAKVGLDGHDRGPRWWRAACVTRAWKSCTRACHRTPKRCGGRGAGRRGRPRGEPAFRCPHDAGPKVLELMRRAARGRPPRGRRVVPDEDVPSFARSRERRHPSGHAADEIVARLRALAASPRPADRRRAPHGRSRPRPHPARARAWISGCGRRATISPTPRPPMIHAGCPRSNALRPPRATRSSWPSCASRYGTRGSAARSIARNGKRRACRPTPWRARGSRRLPRGGEGRVARGPGRASALRRLLGIEPRDVARIHGTSGTTGGPPCSGGSGRLARIGEAHARILWGAAFGLTIASSSAPSSASTWLMGRAGRAWSGWARRRFRSGPV